MSESSRLLPARERVADLLRRSVMQGWLVSLFVHLLALLVLSLLAVGARPRGAAIVSLTITPSAPRQAAPNDDETGGPIEPAGGGKTGLSNPGQAPAAAGAASAAAAALAALLDEKPPVDPSYALPQGLARLGPTALEGGGIASALGSTRGNGTGSRAGQGLGIGGKARTAVFGVPGEGHKFVYVFDRSGSMGGTGRNALTAAKAELLASLDNLEQTHQFQIIFYNEQPLVFNPTGQPGKLVFATERNKALARQFIGSITADGGTRHEEALVMAMKMRPDVIFFLTDADEPKLWPAQLDKLHRLAGGTTINAIEFGFGPQADADDFLVRLARQNGGQHGYVDVSRLFPVGRP